MSNPILSRLAFYRERVLRSNSDGSPPSLLDCAVLETEPLPDGQHRVRYLWFGRADGKLDGIDATEVDDIYGGEYIATNYIPRADDVEYVRALAERTLSRYDKYRELQKMPARVVAAKPKQSFWRRLANKLKGK